MADNNPSSKPTVIIIRRKKKGGHGEGHHGGAWKVAYADFVTAMMSFFLLMWLLNVTTDVQRRGIADYFSPASISQSTSGSGGVMGGRTISPDGSQISSSSPITPNQSTIPTAGKGEEGEEGEEDEAGANTIESIAASRAPPLTAEEKAAALIEEIKHEDEIFQKIEHAIRQALEDMPDLRDFAQNLLIDRTSEGLRIQIVDRDNLSMFPSGSSIPYERSRNLLRLMGKIMSRLPNNISITGHTDSNPFSAGSRRDNWGLSTERANISRGELNKGGVAEDRIARVSGMSDRDPIELQNPRAAMNRRISIVLLRRAPIAEAPEPQNQSGKDAPKEVPKK